MLEIDIVLLVVCSHLCPVLAENVTFGCKNQVVDLPAFLTHCGLENCKLQTEICALNGLGKRPKLLDLN